MSNIVKWGDFAFEGGKQLTTGNSTGDDTLATWLNRIVDLLDGTEEFSKVKVGTATGGYTYVTTYAGDPTNNLTPTAKGEVCVDTTTPDIYIASTTASAGWKKITRAA